VLLLRADADGVPAILDLTGQILEQFDLNHFEGHLVVATPGGIRIRRSEREV
jgi:hypothetical protein